MDPTSSVRMEMGVAHVASVRVLVDVDGAAAPPHQETYGEADDHEADEGLGAALGPRGQGVTKQDQGQPEPDERDRMPQSPGQARMGRLRQERRPSLYDHHDAHRGLDRQEGKRA